MGVTAEQVLYPETAGLGFPRGHHQAVYFAHLRGLLEPHMRLLDLGAGRGKWADTAPPGMLKLVDLRDQVAEVVGCDVDKDVLDNPLVHAAVVQDDPGRLPFRDGSFDVVHSWAVFEHVSAPEGLAGELGRVLRPGGWLAAWTPNRWGYVAVGARLVPNRWHAPVLSRMGALGDRGEHDVFPTVYGMNSLGRLRELFPPDGWDDFSYPYGTLPAYYGRSVVVGLGLKWWLRVCPERTKPFLHVFMRKRP